MLRCGTPEYVNSIALTPYMLFGTEPEAGLTHESQPVL